MAGLDDSAITVLEGLVDAQQMADERPTVVVVVASSADTTSPAVAAQLEALTGGSGSHLQLPNAVHEVRPAEWSSHQNGQHHTCQVGGAPGVAAHPLSTHAHSNTKGQQGLELSLPISASLSRPHFAAANPLQGGSHPVFAGLRRSAKHMTVKALGDCGPSLAGAGQASATTLRAELEAAAGRGQPTVVVLCPGAAADLAVTAHGGTVPGGEEAQLLAVAAQLLAELAPRHLLVHVPHAGTALAAGSQQAGMRRQLLGLHPKDAANRTGNYTICDPTCQKHVGAAAAAAVYCAPACRPVGLPAGLHALRLCDVCPAMLRTAVARHCKGRSITAASAASHHHELAAEPPYDTFPSAQPLRSPHSLCFAGDVVPGLNRAGGQPPGFVRGLLLHAPHRCAHSLPSSRGSLPHTQRLS